MREIVVRAIEIDSLTRFVTEVVNYKEYFFRGEPKDYKSTKNMSSGFRWMTENNKSFYYMKNLRKDYYQEIGYSLSEKDEDNFIAYCQHHGLPTELIDITENPLVALYFACEKDQEQEGYVYLFNKHQFNEVPLEKSIINKKISEQSFNLLDCISVKSFYNEGSDTEFLTKEIDELRKIEVIDYANGQYRIGSSAHINSQIREEVYKQYKIAFAKNPDFFKITGPNFYGIDSKTGEEIIPHFSEKQDIIEMLKDEKKALGIFTPIRMSDIKSKEEWDEIENRYNWYLSDIIWDLFAEMVDNQKVWGINIDFSIFPYFIHKPSVKFDRMVNQQGIFIIQQYFHDKPQELIPNVVFKVSNKKEILKELDRIGISKKFIYPDHDHIAQYVKEKKVF
ncbi:FRG domain-containing protein [Lactococcus petauri]|uniref:FRG domain-containing protein n=1 Tax=Lactococcus TaxID=1357 RepID=UPI001A90CF59|nr:MULTISPECIES: FRG domain-containing protein [Lactococcus]MCG3096703.1 FRG domain-containing protein [Lactococcus petauri]QSQ99010.1 FRG domain-containing protein [Lactococcus garvieae]